MIYVTIGGHPQGFDRLVRAVDEVAQYFNNEEFIVQKGVSAYTPKNCKFFDFVQYEENEIYIKQARLVISHAGVGTILVAKKYNVPIIIVPRLKKYNEHLNDHQLDICNALIKEPRKGVYVVLEVKCLQQTIEKVLSENQREIKNNQNNEKGKEKIIQEIEKFIDFNKRKKVLIINSLDSSYGSTHRIRKFYFHLLKNKNFRVKYIESNSNISSAINVRQKNNAIGFLCGTIQRFFLTLILPFDILFTQTITPLTVPSILVAKLKRKKVVVDWDDLSWVLQKNWFRKLLVRFCEHFFIKLVDVVFVPNKYLLEYAHKLIVKRVCFVPHGIDLEIFDPQKYTLQKVKEEIGIKNNNLVLGFLASFTTGGVGDLDFIYDSVVEVQKVFPEVNFLVIGGGPLYRDYVKMAYEKGVKNIFFTGLLKQKDIPKYVSVIDIALIFMRDNIKNKMKTSLKVGEYLAMNKIVVGYLVGQTKDDFGKYCIFCEPNKKSFVNKIIEVIKEKDKMIKNFREELKSYSWENSGSIVAQILEELC